MAETQGKNLEAETEAEIMEEHFLLSFSPWPAQFAFLYIPGSPAQGWHCSQWAGPTNINY